MTNAEKVIKFIETYCRVPEGDLVGRPLELADFQKQFLTDLYDNPARTRRAILSMGRKNGKTALVSCILLAHIVGPMASRTLRSSAQRYRGAGGDCVPSRGEHDQHERRAGEGLQGDAVGQDDHRAVPKRRVPRVGTDGSTAMGLSPVWPYSMRRGR